MKLLKLVRGDIRDVIGVCETKLKQTNYLRSLINDLVKGIVYSIVEWRFLSPHPGIGWGRFLSVNCTVDFRGMR